MNRNNWLYHITPIKNYHFKTRNKEMCDNITTLKTRAKAEPGRNCLLLLPLWAADLMPSSSCGADSFIWQSKCDKNIKLKISSSNTQFQTQSFKSTKVWPTQHFKSVKCVAKVQRSCKLKVSKVQRSCKLKVSKVQTSYHLKVSKFKKYCGFKIYH